MELNKKLVLLVVVGGASFAMGQAPGTFTQTGSMITPRVWHTATLLPGGMVLVAGGMNPTTTGFYDPSTAALATAELYDPLTGTFIPTGSMSVPRYDHTATLLPDGRVLIGGGGDATGHFSLTAELYDPATGTFSPTGGLGAAHWTATLLDNGEVFMGPVTPGDVAELYDPSTGTFTATGGNLIPATAFVGRTNTLLADGRILSPADSPSEIFDPATGSFSLTGAMIHAQALLQRSATLLPNGNVLFAGGEIDNEYNIGFDPAYPDSTYPYGEIYDPSAGSFAATANLIEPRAGHTATLLPDSSTLIAGGSEGSTLQSAELYDTSLGSFNPAGNMITSRRFHVATLLNDGRVLITGGMHSLGPAPQPEIVLASAEVYTPALPVPAPALFSLSGDGQGQGAVWHTTTGALASPANPAVAGEALSMYTNHLIDSGIIPPQVAVGGRPAEVLYFGDAPGCPGYYQVNFRMPKGVAPAQDVAVRLIYVGRSSNEVTLSVQ
ncbi:MAG: hypothetical protein JO099_04785 [Acidobacteriia bacterium]|nr:hypothetical protein [Terriglobia bacterium]